MRTLRLGGQHDTEIVLDLCFACHGIWFDRRETQLQTVTRAQILREAGRYQAAFDVTAC